MTETKITPGLTYDFQVEGVFDMSDEGYFFVGKPNNMQIVHVPARADIVMAGKKIGQILLTSYSWPLNPKRRDLVTLITKDNLPVDHRDLESGGCVLYCTVLEERGA